MIKDIEYFIKKTFFSKNFLLKRRLEREISKNYEKELSIIHDYEDKNKAAIDVGVYRGVYSYKLSKHFKKVFSFEPNPLIYENLNSTLTKITNNIEIFNYALSNTEGITKLKIPNRGNSLFDKNYEELFKLGAATIHEENDIIDYESFDVKKTLLDKIIPSSEKIGFIKIDVEGHESEVIKGSIDTIKRDKPILLIEIEEKHTKKPINDTINFVKNIGYDCYQLHNREISKFEIKKHNIKDNNFIFLPN